MELKPRYSKLTKLFILAPFLFFSVMLIKNLNHPTTFVFDETHYVPAAKNLILQKNNINPEHPPLAKFILGTSWFILAETLSLTSDIVAMRFINAIFGLLSLFSIFLIMRRLNFSIFKSLIATWITGFNILWFVQSKIAMLDVFYLCFSLYGILCLWIYALKRRNFSQLFYGFFLIGLALACKWSALIYFFIGLAIVLNTETARSRLFFIISISFCVLSFNLGYVLGNLPLFFFDEFTFQSFFQYHVQMLKLITSTSNADHPYASNWWQWPTLLRPMWYLFETVDQGRGTSNTFNAIWAGGNPAVFWGSLASVFSLIICMLFKLKKAKSYNFLLSLYLGPLIFWMISPRNLQFFYYFLPSSMIQGPLIVAALDNVKARSWLLLGFTALCFILFLYFMPILDARSFPENRYHIYMWLESWI